jgi:hypothetical protein
LDPAVVKQHREEFEKKSGKRARCSQCECEMSRNGCYHRTDVRNGDGERLEPIPIQRWACKEHGVVSFLPHFLAGGVRYLAETVGRTLKSMVDDGKPRFPDDVTGPDPRTARRWFECLRSPEILRWLLQRLRGSPPATSGAASLIEAAESYARQLSLDPVYFFRVLHSARFHATAR